MNPEPTDTLEALKHAVESDDAGRVANLLERHPELKARLNDPVAAFDAPLVTRARGHAMLDALLAAGADLNAKSQWWAGGFGILHGAPPDLARHAIARGAVVDIHAAARLGLMERLRELISADPSVVASPGGDGQTPLHFAGTIEVAEYLLAHGADCNALDVDHESTPAQYMVRDRQEIARLLVKAGCRTDLLLASALGDLELVRRHLDADPDCIRMNVSERFFPKRDPRSGGCIYIWTLGQYKTAHAVAREFGHAEVLRLLTERSPDELKLVQAAASGDEATAKALLAARPDLVASLAENDRRTLAHMAQHNDVRAVRLMLSVGWPVDVRGQHGATPLHWAAFHGNAEMVETLLRHGPPLESTDADFHGTPLGWATHGSEHGWCRATGDYVGCVERLLAAGAKLPEQIKGTEVVQAVLRRIAAGTK